MVSRRRSGDVAAAVFMEPSGRRCTHEGHKRLKGEGCIGPVFEHDACGIGAVVDIQGRASSRDCGRRAEDRGEAGAPGRARMPEGETGDGVGILAPVFPRVFCQGGGGGELRPARTAGLRRRACSSCPRDWSAAPAGPETVRTGDREGRHGLSWAGGTVPGASRRFLGQRAQGENA